MTNNLKAETPRLHCIILEFATCKTELLSLSFLARALKTANCGDTKNADDHGATDISPNKVNHMSKPYITTRGVGYTRTHKETMIKPMKTNNITSSIVKAKKNSASSTIGNP
jgi:hypothetical protein